LRHSKHKKTVEKNGTFGFAPPANQPLAKPKSEFFTNPLSKQA